MLDEIPNRRRQDICSRVQEWGEIVRLVPPVRQVTSRWPRSHAPLVHVQQKLTVPADMHNEMRWHASERERFAKVKHGRIAHRPVRANDPRCRPMTKVRVGFGWKPGKTEG